MLLPRYLLYPWPAFRIIVDETLCPGETSMTKFGLSGSSTQEEYPRIRMTRIFGAGFLKNYLLPARASRGRGTYALRPQRDIAHPPRASCVRLGGFLPSAGEAQRPKDPAINPHPRRLHGRNGVVRACFAVRETPGSSSVQVVLQRLYLGQPQAGFRACAAAQEKTDS